MQKFVLHQQVQGLLLDHISVSLDDTIFGLGQAYMALSQGRTWEGVEIIDLNWNAFLTDQEVVEEYE